MMLTRSFRLTGVLCCLLSGAMLLVAPSARAGAKEDVAAAAAKWETAFADDNPDSIAALYDDEAVLWGTLYSTISAGKQAVRSYFEKSFPLVPGHKIAFRDQLIRVYGDIAINTGYYTISYAKDGKAKTLPARYSFVYRKRDGNWLIVDHHSSAMPTPAGRASLEETNRQTAK